MKDSSTRVQRNMLYNTTQLFGFAPRVRTMIGENWQLVTNEPVEFEK